MSVLRMARSAVGAGGTVVSVSVDELLPDVGSVVPAGGATVAVFTRFPAAPALTVPLSVSVTLWPTARFNPVQAPVPELYVPVFAVKTGLVIAAGTASVTVMLVTVDGPLLVTVIV